MSALPVIFTIAWVVIGFFVLHKLAQSRGRNPITWGVFGAISFVIALIAILIAGDSKEKAQYAS